ncbi:hydroxypyruvate isomerase family protein [Prauserella cavernicola]|uniref:hydroxypyruvate isomerase family protein n=1 Tax=Prauserella cavernicola TaxID=2800127 RepID=UPI0027DE3C64|nr:TIM barrel protein [Prauserella cavernicola]
MRHHGLDVSANVSILFPELDYLDRFAAARDAGFDAVESWWPFPVGVPPRAGLDAVLAALDGAGLRLTGLNFWAGDMPAGQRGMAIHAERHDELRANIELVGEVAERTGCRHFNLLYGQLAPGQSAEQAAEVAAGVFREATAAVSAFGGTVLLEPLARGLNGDYPITTVAEALAVLDLMDTEGVSLLFDTFHLGHNGEDLVAAATAHVDRIGHVQVADDPGRGEPGSGTLPLDECLDALREAGYSGRVGAEYKPTTPDTRDSFGWLA